jgi:putative Holliday junction resolvase
MGLDVGTKTVGVAVSDELGLTGQAVTTVRRTNLRADLDALANLAQERGVDQLVVGLPMNMDGSEGPSAQMARALGDKLAKRTSLPLAYWDERLTTREAQRTLLEADVSRARRRKVIDQVAAALILQGWLDARAHERGDADPAPGGDWSDS